MYVFVRICPRGWTGTEKQAHVLRVYNVMVEVEFECGSVAFYLAKCSSGDRYGMAANNKTVPNYCKFNLLIHFSGLEQTADKVLQFFWGNNTKETKVTKIYWHKLPKT